MGGASSFLAMLSIACFLTCAWLATKISKAAGVSSIVLEITTGVILGPAVLGVVTPNYAECQYSRHVDCTVPSNAEELALAGQSLGESLDDVISGGSCAISDYAHATDDHTTGDATGDTTDHTAEETTGNTDSSHTTDETHSTEDTTEDTTHSTEETAAADTSTHGAADHHRRLSGGGDYATFSECLEKTCEAEVSTHCQLTPDFFTLIGHTGVALMIFESGMHFDFEKAGQVGPRACLVAVVGTILPLISGALLTVVFGRPLMPDGVSVGTALAPTSVGIALRLLGEAKVLQMDFGQAIITAAFVDDILSLILFNILFSLTGEFHFMSVVVYPIVGILFMMVAIVGAVKFWPKFIETQIMARIPESKEELESKTSDSVSPRDEALFFIMMLLLVVYATFTYFLGTHLWGCFIAGMSFACVTHRFKHHWPHNVWVKQTKRATSWMIRIFFAATVAFSIPIAKLLSFEAFWKGTIMGLGPCIASKVLCAPFMGHAKFVIGWAMVGRAEFAYLIAQMAAAAGMVDEKTFSIVIWALLYATVFAPFVFRKVLSRYVEQHCKEDIARAESDGTVEPVEETLAER